jgi:chromosome segregation ATPase
MIYATIGLAAFALLVVNALMGRSADKLIAARDQRIATLYNDFANMERNAAEWKATADRLRVELGRAVDRRIALDDALTDADRRAADAGREATAARQEANRHNARANRAETALRAIARKVGAPEGHPDVGEKIMERLEAEWGKPRR